MYISPNFLCFIAFIFGIKTTEIIPFADISDLRSKAAGGDFVMRIQTSNNKYNFSSNPEKGKKYYDRINRLWSASQDRGKSNFNFEVLNNKSSELNPSDNTDVGIETDVDADADLLTKKFQQDGFLTTLQENKMTELLRNDFNISVVNFFKSFYSNDSDFCSVYHKQINSEDLVVGEWAENPTYGLCRELKYKVPVKAAIGPDKTRVVEIQRYHLQKEEFKLETSMTMSDVPYCDYFTVETLWEVVQPGSRDDQCRLTIKVGVNFVKKTWLKGMIESSTIKESKESFEIWLRLAHDKLSSSSTSQMITSPRPGAKTNAQSPNTGTETAINSTIKSGFNQNSATEHADNPLKRDDIRKLVSILLPILFLNTLLFIFVVYYLRSIAISLDK